MDANDFLGGGETLTAQELQEAGGRMTLTVKEVRKKEYPDGVKPLILTEEMEKLVPFNKTSVRAMSNMYGDKGIDKAWVGKTFAIEVREVQNPKTNSRGPGIFVIEQNQNQLALDAFSQIASEAGYTPKERAAFLARFPNDPVGALVALRKELDPQPPF